MDVPVVLSDEDYDVISNPGQQSLESSVSDFGRIPGQVHEPPPSQAARDKFVSLSWTADEIQDYIRKKLGIIVLPEGTRRVYVDGIFDGFHAGHALQLRQAKLSFPSVYLMVGVYPDEQLRLNGYVSSFSHVERCEVLRHCRWVDEVVTEAPWVLDPQFISDHKIDYVALDEGTSVDPTCDKARLKGYDIMKSLKVIVPTRKTGGLTVTLPIQPITALTPTIYQPESSTDLLYHDH